VTKMDVNQLTNSHSRKTLEQILNSSEFTQNQVSENLQEFFRNLEFGGHYTVGNTEALLTVSEVLIGAAGIILVVYFFRSLGSMGKLMVKEVNAKDTIQTVEVRSIAVGLLQEAEKMAVAGEFRRALRNIYLSVLWELDSRQLIIYKAAKTNSEYYQEISQRAADLKELFRSLVTLFDYKWYGLEKCTKEDVQKGRELYDAMLKGDAHA
jgi:hypothetical protein